ncbi:DUF72 domain-containing protein [Olivibacter domesticus]|uniref:Uncharacterized conserved protein YecE, DUF72 family n=1 Tax=Olivibacter domesticus TaxID=407022 RepID=A0A1H7ZS14_OLID1|nr:DUF72 domain-containing protein [Olivibacter domesticus]SEM58663.1 Uncharacterized conserved protein YecE, DUF72 family [Olivibacter domesticus]SEM61432.1 Uncharacterized conserved protein YecE, DUF72 family [Olivibacter domesticus]
MKFGQVEDPSKIDFSLPSTHPDTYALLEKAGNGTDIFEVFVGCAKWNKQDLKGFYPRGTKDELSYYASQFNAIELNATFYNSPDKQQVDVWKNKVPEGFKFFPKIPNTVSHFRRLVNSKEPTEAFCDAISFFEDKLGMTFLQMHDNFKPSQFDRLKEYVTSFPKGIPLAIEVRNEEWFADKDASEKYFSLLEKEKVANVVVDTAGRRDLLHMRLTTPQAFVRYVGANHKSDYARLDDWIDRIKEWRDKGLKSLYFFVHQNIEKESPLLSAYFIEKLNLAFHLDLKLPASQIDMNQQQASLHLK